MVDEIPPTPEHANGQPDAEPDRMAQPVDAEQPPRLSFPVVGVGASAGGLEAFGEFLTAMRPDAGLAFVFVLHLPPDHSSMLAEVLSRRTSMPVQQAEDGMQVEPDHVYVLRPGHVLTIRDGRLHLGPELGGPRAANRPVDDFFRSLAEEQRERAICVILSGMGSNGTAGAQAVKAVGGLCVAQDPESAAYPSMPRHLIDAGYADYIVRPNELPEVLLAYSGSPYATGGREADSAAILGREEQHVREILAVLRSRSKQDFNGYKKATVLRRVQRRMGLARAGTLAEYARLLRQSPAEVTALADDLLIHVTVFFRDPEAWEAFQQAVIEPLIATREAGGAVRAWVAACSSGEEAYTLAMLLTEEADRIGKRLDVKVFATDLADRALAHARAGVYAGGIESDVTPERLSRFFVKEDEVYRIRQELRDRVVFAPQNILRDPPFSRLDIATCRNLLIYLEPTVQHRVLALLHFGLREGGALFLGSSETVGGADGMFEPLDKKHRIFRRVGPTRHGTIDFSLPRMFSADGGNGGGAGEVVQAVPRRRESDRPLAELARRTLLQWHTPAAVLVDRDNQVLYYHGDCHPYLRQASGEPTRDVLLLARDGVRGAVRSALYRAASGERVTAPDGWIERDSGRSFRVYVTATPVVEVGGGSSVPASHFVVSFEERGEVAPLAASVGSESADEVRRLRSELQGTIEELQTSNEELKASHEEAMSVNEEVQSANEELEASKEEMQSLNEELTTVNAQLRAKMEEHAAASSDMASLLASTDIAVLFLDVAFRIRRYTPAARELVDLIPGDVGRPLSALARKFDDPHLDKDCQAVLDRLRPVEREVTGLDARHYSRRVTPYRTMDNRIDGVVVAFIDVTSRKQAEDAVRASEEQFRRSIEDAPIPVIMQSEDGQVLQISRTWTELTGYALSDLPTADAWLTRAYGPGADAVRAHMHDLFLGKRKILDVEFAIRTRDGADRHWSFSASAPGTLRDGRRFLVGMAVDITERTQADIALRASEERLRAVAANLPGGAVFVIGPDLRYELADGEGLREAGFTSAEYEGKTLAEALPADLAGASEANCRGAFAGEPFLTEHAAGARHFVTRGVPLRDAAGRVTAVLAVSYDITDRVRAEERLRLALAAARMGIWTLEFGTGDHTRDANLNALLGLPAAETTQPFGEFLAHVHPDDREAVRGAFAASVREGQPLNVEFRIVRPDGEVRWLRDQGDVFGDSDAHARHMAGACVDVTERKAAEEASRASEERIRLIMESTDFAIIALAPNRTVTHWGSGAAAIFGYAAAEIVGQSADLLFVSEDRAAQVPEREAAEAEQDGRATDERWHLRKDGTRFWASGVLNPLRDGRGFVKVLRDLTERKRMEDEIRDARDLLEKRVTERTAELENAMDALENEMGRRRALAQRLSTAQEDEQRRFSRDLHDTVGQLMAGLSLAFKAIETAGELAPSAASRMAEAQRIMNELGRELHGLAVRLRPTSLDDIGLESALGQLVSEWSARSGVPVDFHAAGLNRLPPDVETAIYRVVQEALTNIAKHAKASSVSVVATRPDGFVAVVVEDNGGGFDPTVTPSGRLGLLGMRERVELIGGEVDIESNAGAGTTLTVQIPIT
ncbi:MAG: PAS domain S-box protein [Gemmataceae bacterium]|nr:PAS domain S-box protein [Gemmataceae bacterium]